MNDISIFSLLHWAMHFLRVFGDSRVLYFFICSLPSCCSRAPCEKTIGVQGGGHSSLRPDSLANWLTVRLGSRDRPMFSSLFFSDNFFFLSFSSIHLFLNATAATAEPLFHLFNNTKRQRTVFLFVYLFVDAEPLGRSV